MPRVKTTSPDPSRQKGQRSLDLPLYINRLVPRWSQPAWLEASMWRSVVAHQPVATVCRDTLIANLTALDWSIEPRESTKRDELKSLIKYYTEFFNDTGDYDFSDIVEWLGKDALDIPFGGAAEVGREGDNPKGKVLWLELLDGGTLFPTLNEDWPIGQQVQGLPNYRVYFPYYAINRIYLSPRTEIERKGWAMPPPEKIYLALELLNRGDVYYANLLLDTPEVGILDLGDIDKESAEAWLESWHTMLSGIDPFKVPILYEHEKPATFVSFTRPPAELMFDKATGKYAALVAAGYGMSMSDIGISAVGSGGETLAGSIRQERKTRKTGLSQLKMKFKHFFDRLLPDTLQFNWIDLDDELAVSTGRALLAMSTALGQLVDKRMLTSSEGRRQMIASGLITIPIPEEPPEDELTPIEKPAPERPGMLGAPVPASQGGQGEVRSDVFSSAIQRILNLDNIHYRRVIRAVQESALSEYTRLSNIGLNEDDVLDMLDLQEKLLFNDEVDIVDIPDGFMSLTTYSVNTVLDTLNVSEWNKPLVLDANELVELFYGVFATLKGEELKHKYECGDTDTLPDTVLPTKEQVASFLEKMSIEMHRIWDEEFFSLIAKSFVIGIRKTVKSANNIANLTDEGYNQIADNVKAILKEETDKLLSRFVLKLITIVKTIMEE